LHSWLARERATSKARLAWPTAVMLVASIVAALVGRPMVVARRRRVVFIWVPPVRTTRSMVSKVLLMRLPGAETRSMRLKSKSRLLLATSAASLLEFLLVFGVAEVRQDSCCCQPGAEFGFLDF